jgi:uncharacterized protein (DUF697 family)
MFGFFVFISAFDLSVNRAIGQTCGETADADIVSNIYAKIKGNSKIADQATHINITSINRVVKIQGWADSASDRTTVYNFAMGTACVNMVNDKEFMDSKPTEDQLRSMCSGGTKPCGDICIPAGDSCNITGGGNTKN